MLHNCMVTTLNYVISLPNLVIYLRNVLVDGVVTHITFYVSVDRSMHYSLALLKILFMFEAPDIKYLVIE